MSDILDEGYSPENRIVVSIEDLNIRYQELVVGGSQPINARRFLSGEVWKDFERIREGKETLVVGSINGEPDTLHFNSIVIANEEGLSAIISNLLNPDKNTSLRGLYSIDLKKLKHLKES